MPEGALRAVARAVSVGAVALLAVGCLETVDEGPAPDRDVAAVDDPFAEYRLGPGDRLQINVFGQDDLSGEYAVDASGNLAFPILGAVTAGNKSVDEVREEIVASLADGFVINPLVSIEVLNYRPFYVLGEVRRPGSYPFVAGIDVRQAVAIAGGYNRRARKSPVIISRRFDEEVQRIAVDPDTLVLPGDTLDVERRLF